MRNRVVVRSLVKSFNKLEPKIAGVMRRLFLLKKIKNCYVEIFLTNSTIMDKNVLSFEAPRNFPRPDVKQKNLGEIYLNPDYIKKHGDDWVFMLIHGFLHLLGYDHKKKNDTIKMEKEEQQLLNKFRS